MSRRVAGCGTSGRGELPSENMSSSSSEVDRLGPESRLAALSNSPVDSEVACCDGGDDKSTDSKDCEFPQFWQTITLDWNDCSWAAESMVAVGCVRCDGESWERIWEEASVNGHEHWSQIKPVVVSEFRSRLSPVDFGAGALSSQSLDEAKSGRSFGFLESFIAKQAPPY